MADTYNILSRNLMNDLYVADIENKQTGESFDSNGIVSVDIPTSPKRKDSPLNSPRPPSSPRNGIKSRNHSGGLNRINGEDESSTPLSQEQLSNLIDLLVKGRDVHGLSSCQYNQVLEKLFEARDSAVNSNNLKESESLTYAVESIEKSRINELKEITQKEAISLYQQQLAGFKQEISKFDEETKHLIDHLIQKKKSQRCKLELHHSELLDKHTQEWTSQKKHRMYNRASTTLVFLRKQSKVLIQQSRFREAEDVQQVMVVQEKKEREIAIRKMQKDYEDSLKKLTKKIDEELEFHDSNEKISIAQLKQKREQLRVALLNRLKKIQKAGEKANDVEKIWNSRQIQRLECTSSDTSVRPPSPRKTKTRTSQDDSILILPPLQTYGYPKNKGSLSSRTDTQLN